MSLLVFPTVVGNLGPLTKNIFIVQSSVPTASITSKMLEVTDLRVGDTLYITDSDNVTSLKSIGDGFVLADPPIGITVENILTSTSTTNALSSNMGRVLHDSNRIYFGTVSDALSFNYDTLENPDEPKFVHISQDGQNDRNFYIYYPGLNPNIPDSPLVKTTTGTTNPGALVRLDVVKRSSSSQQLNEFLSFSSTLPNNWHIEPQTDDDSLQLLWQGLKWPVLIKRINDNTVNANSSRLINVNTPTSDNDASTKQYVDNKFGEVSGALVYKGILDASGAASQLDDAQVGWFWLVDVAGTLLGKELKVGDEVFCKTAITGTPTDFSSFEDVPTSDGVLRTTDVINVLNSTVEDKPLSAAMGNYLFQEKLDRSQVNNTLTSTSTTDALSAAQGKNLQDTKLNISDFELYSGLPGLPIPNPTVAYLADASLCTIDSQGRCSSMIDPINSNSVAQSDNTLKPILNVNSANRRYYLRFDSSRLVLDGFDASGLGGVSGNTGSFVLVANTDSIVGQSQFNWVKGTSGNYDLSIRYGVHLPWSNGNLYVDFASTITGRLEITGQTGLTGNIEKYIYVRNGSNATLYRNGVSIGTASGLTSAFSSGDIGRFTIGDGNELDQFCNMDFYALIIYDKALTESEIKTMSLYLDKTF